jgi:aldose 1-epimerase
MSGVPPRPAADSSAAAADGYETIAIGSPGGALQATFVPGAGMLCCSLRHRGVELLAQLSGVRAYAQRGATMGIPLLYPWANRLAGLSYPGPDGEVRLAAQDPLLKLDPNGLPIHGAIPGALAWELLDAETPARELRARLSWTRAELLAIFPYRHTVEVQARIEGETTLAIETVVRAGQQPTPVSFGYHPYLTLPGCERGRWTIELPMSRSLALDELMIPTGRAQALVHRRFELGDGSWDDAYAGLLDPPVFTLRSDACALGLSLELRRGYTHAQLYAPRGEQFVCFEPMTAPGNALRSREQLPLALPGEPHRAAFAVSVHERQAVLL